jgi:hypothetical protein
MKKIPNQTIETNMRGISYGQSRRGFIQILVVIVLALVILHLLDIDIQTVLARPGVHDFAVYIKQMLVLVWQDLKEIFYFVKNAK